MTTVSLQDARELALRVWRLTGDLNLAHKVLVAICRSNYYDEAVECEALYHAVALDLKAAAGRRDNDVA